MGKEYAKKTLIHYFRLLFEQSGLAFNTDNQTEIEGIIDAIYEDIKK